MLREQIALEKKNQHDQTENFKSNLCKIESKLKEVESDRDKHRTEVQALKDSEEARFYAREENLAAISLKIQKRKDDIDQHERELQNRERSWKEDIMPQLKRYETHQKLDQRQAELELRERKLDAQLHDSDQKRSELEEKEKILLKRHNELNDWDLNLRAEKQKFSIQIEFAKNAEAIIKENDTRASMHVNEIESLKIQLEDCIAKEQRCKGQLDVLQLFGKTYVDAINPKDECSSVCMKKIESLNTQLDNCMARERYYREKLHNLNELHGQLEHASKQKEVRASRDSKEIKSLNTQLKACMAKEQLCQRLLKQCEDSKPEYDASRTHPRPGPAGNSGIEIIKRGLSSSIPDFSQVDSPLKSFGYKVGFSGIIIPEERRNKLMDFIQTTAKKIPKVGPVEYMKHWGEKNSDQRVYCMAHHIAWNINFQGKKEGNELAREHWISDLRWMKEQYGDALADKDWPTIPRR